VGGAPACLPHTLSAEGDAESRSPACAGRVAVAHTQLRSVLVSARAMDFNLECLEMPTFFPHRFQRDFFLLLKDPKGLRRLRDPGSSSEKWIFRFPLDMDTLEDWTGKNEERPLKALLLRAEVEADQGVFCSGGDLHLVSSIMDGENGRRMSLIMHDWLSRMRRLPAITACLVNGRAIGGGAELTLATDWRLFTPEGSLRFVQASMGIAPGWGGASRLVELVGPARAMHILLSRRKIHRQEASSIGLCDGHVEDDIQAEDWLWSLSEALPAEVIRTNKAMCHNGSDVGKSLDEKLAVEGNLFASLWGGPAHQAAMKKGLKH